MEKFYIIPSDHEVAAQYWKYQEFERDMINLFNEFANTHGIEASKFAIRTDRLQIVPTDNDMKKFKGEFLSGKEGQFKKGSEFSKAWIKAIKDSGIEYVSKPYPPFIFGMPLGRSWYRLFNLHDVIYCTMENANHFDNPAGFEEIPGSYFYKIMEDNHIQI